jgi:hypothetical protein
MKHPGNVASHSKIPVSLRNSACFDGVRSAKAADMSAKHVSPPRLGRATARSSVNVLGSKSMQLSLCQVLAAR